MLGKWLEGGISKGCIGEDLLLVSASYFYTYYILKNSGLIRWPFLFFQEKRISGICLSETMAAQCYCGREHHFWKPLQQTKVMSFSTFQIKIREELIRINYHSQRWLTWLLMINRLYSPSCCASPPFASDNGCLGMAVLYGILFTPVTLCWPQT